MTQINATDTSLTLLNAIASGDDSAWVRFVLHYRPLIFQRCQKLGLSVHDSENMTQEIFLELFQRIDRFSRDRGRFRNWLALMIRSRIIDSYRAKRLAIDQSVDTDFIASIMPDEVEGNDAHRGRHEVNTLIDAIRAEFTDRDWTIFYLSLGEERPSRDVAEAVNVTENTVYLTKSRMLKRLRKLFTAA